MKCLKKRISKKWQCKMPGGGCATLRGNHGISNQASRSQSGKRGKMKIVNETNWVTKHLRAFVIQVCKKELLDADFRRHLRVTFKPRRRTCYWLEGYVGGCAWYNQPRMIIRIVKGNVPPSKTMLAHVIAHELAHIQGICHKNMHSTRYSWSDGWKTIWNWAENLPLEHKVITCPPMPTRSEKAQIKLVKAQSQLKRWESRKQLAITKVKKYSAKVTCYQKQIM